MESKKRNQILLVLFIGVLMGALDIAIVGPALPSIKQAFGVDERTLPWMFSMYVLFNLIGTPLMAKLSDLFGRRSIYVLDVFLFGVGSLVVALSGSFIMVLVGRAIQGFGAGGIFPVASAVIGDTFPAEKRGSALGLIGAVFGIAFLVGPLLGVLILAVASWHWLFLINLPIAAIVIYMALKQLPATRPAVVKAFDWPGMIVLTVMLASLAYGINQIDTKTFVSSLLSVQVLPFLLTALVAGLVLAAIERRAENPIMPPTLFNRGQLRLAYALSAGAGFGEASLVFLPLLAVAALGSNGVTEKSASSLLLPVVLALAVGSPLVGRMLDKVGSRLVIMFGTLLMTLGMFLISQFAASMAMFILSGALIGLGLSALLGAPIRYIMLNEVAATERSTAQGVLTIFTSVGQLVGSSMVGAVAQSRIIVGDPTSTIAAYSTSFFVISVVGILLVGAAYMLKNRVAEQATVQHNQAAAAPQA